jgi:hypothetical protein
MPCPPVDLSLTRYLFSSAKPQFSYQGLYNGEETKHSNDYVPSAKETLTMSTVAEHFQEVTEKPSDNSGKASQSAMVRTASNGAYRPSYFDT